LPADKKFTDAEGGELVTGSVVKELGCATVPCAGGQASCALKGILKALCLSLEITETVDGVQLFHELLRKRSAALGYFFTKRVMGAKLFKLVAELFDLAFGVTIC
jgi:hypothetical protein